MLISKFWLYIVRNGRVIKHAKVFPSFLKVENAKRKFQLLTTNMCAGLHSELLKAINFSEIKKTLKIFNNDF